MSNRRMGPGMMGPRKPINKATVKRLLGYVKPYWPRLIIVLDNGRVADIGTHEELLARCDIYREVYESQTKGGGADE